MEINIWIEKYRPTSIDELIGNEDIKNKFREFIEKQEIPNLLLYSKNSGTGKSTVAKILSKSIDSDVLYINGADERGIDVVRNKIKGFATVKSFNKFKIIVIEEAGNFTGDFVEAFKNVLESFYASTRFILTTNYPLNEAIESRCQKFELKPNNLDQIVSRCKYILDNENVEYKEEDLLKVIKLSYPDLRTTIGNLQKFSFNGELKLPKELVMDAQWKKMIGSLLKKSEKESIDKIRKLLATLMGVDYTGIYKYLFDNVEDFTNNKNKIGDILVEIAEYMYRDSSVLLKDVNFVACCIKIIEINK